MNRLEAGLAITIAFGVGLACGIMWSPHGTSNLAQTVASMELSPRYVEIDGVKVPLPGDGYEVSVEITEPVDSETEKQEMTASGASMTSKNFNAGAGTTTADFASTLPDVAMGEMSLGGGAATLAMQSVATEGWMGFAMFGAIALVIGCVLIGIGLRGVGVWVAIAGGGIIALAVVARFVEAHPVYLGIMFLLVAGVGGTYVVLMWKGRTKSKMFNIAVAGVEKAKAALREGIVTLIRQEAVAEGIAPEKAEGLIRRMGDSVGRLLTKAIGEVAARDGKGGAKFKSEVVKAKANGGAL